MYEREVEFAVGLNDGTWHKMCVTVPEDESRVLEDDEVEAKALEVIERIGSKEEVAFRAVLYISPPAGGYAEDWDH